jgi:flagellar assembly protein FliH
MSEPSKLTAWERWELASFDEEHVTPAPEPEPEPIPPPPPEPEEEITPQVKLPTAEEIEQINQQARDEGLAQGKEEGYQAGFKEGQAEAQRFTQVAANLDKSLDELDFKVADELLALALELAREVVRQEISARPEVLLAVVREALMQLPHQHVAIYLHPEDASLLRSYMGDQLAHAGHRIHEDFKLARGDCVLEAGGSQVDASVAMRWRRVLENLGIASAWQPDAVPPEPTSGESGQVVSPPARKGPEDGELEDGGQ